MLPGTWINIDRNSSLKSKVLFYVQLRKVFTFQIKELNEKNEESFKKKDVNYNSLDLIL